MDDFLRRRRGDRTVKENIADDNFLYVPVIYEKGGDNPLCQLLALLTEYGVYPFLHFHLPMDDFLRRRRGDRTVKENIADDNFLYVPLIYENGGDNPPCLAFPFH
ncbi:hypothetical protein CDAR_240861 [Caerostris darwini]|uniref:Uncharacterized protein n=1 Tax=Caerostris darwini TaxID=1538125 RepID=A0AAV4TJA5_9ARAC|nr:hypothetical protein CDAR_240861 [Caerostris darwini]